MTDYAALWSHSQQAFHIETVHEMLDANIVAFAQGRQSDYVPVFIGARSDCLIIIEKLKSKMQTRLHRNPHRHILGIRNNSEPA